ncbi:hypothetical protein [Tenacibaculum insulae]|uniref:hypothetical protein n=1 Tax=Tenacibaculum insulae TaxID=2029677 RepID=UPI003AB4D13F
MKKIIYAFIASVFLIGCSSNFKPAKTVSVEPSEEISRDYKFKDFSIVLDDMKIEEEPDFMVYQHKYKVLTMHNDSLQAKKLPWKTVNKKYFKEHENDLGMEIVSKHNGKLSKVAQPVGFGWAIGNENHGEWEAIQGDSTTTKSTESKRRWRTHSTSPFFWYWLATRRSTYRNDYNGYKTHANSGKSYYGSNTSTGNYNYGTRSNYEKTTRSSFFSRKTQNATKWNSLTNKTSRNSSRYSKGSSTRSRSGGYGK